MKVLGSSSVIFTEFLLDEISYDNRIIAKTEAHEHDAGCAWAQKGSIYETRLSILANIPACKDCICSFIV